MDKPVQYIQLQYENMPCFWEISFDRKIPALIVKVHEDFVEFLPPLKNTHMVESLLKEFKFKNFDADWKAPMFGFNGCFQSMNVQDSFIVFSLPLSALEQFHMQTCSQCQGHRRDVLFGGDCLACNNTGLQKKMVQCPSCENSSYPEDCYRCKGSGKIPDSWMEWQSLYAISATLTVFFQFMSFGQQVDKFVACKNPQLLFAETATIKGMGGAPIYGVWSIPLLDWLRKLSPNTHIKEAEEAIKIVWEKIHGEHLEGINKMNTWVEVRNNGWLSMSCPGDRTGLYPAHHGLSVGDGCEFSCHNMDTPIQQVALLCGLGVLCDLVRKEIT